MADKKDRTPKTGDVVSFKWATAQKGTVIDVSEDGKEITVQPIIPITAADIVVDPKKT